MIGDVPEIFLGIVLPATSPLFFALVIPHIVFGVASVVSGLAAMLLTKGRGRHSTLGLIYFWCVAIVFLTAAALAALRWTEDYILFVLGALAFVLVVIGRAALKSRRTRSLRLHAITMGTSYIVLLTAFYVDNGKNLPIWRDLPAITYWMIPSLFGIPLIIRALRKHPLLRP